MKKQHYYCWLFWCACVAAITSSCADPNDTAHDLSADSDFDVWSSPADSRSDVIVEELPDIRLELAPDQETVTQLSALQLRNAAGEETGPIWLRTRITELGGRGLVRDSSVSWSRAANIYTGVIAKDGRSAAIIVRNKDDEALWLASADLATDQLEMRWKLPDTETRDWSEGRASVLSFVKGQALLQQQLQSGERRWHRVELESGSATELLVLPPGEWLAIDVEPLTVIGRDEEGWRVFGEDLSEGVSITPPDECVAAPVDDAFVGRDTVYARALCTGGVSAGEDEPTEINRVFELGDRGSGWQYLRQVCQDGHRLYRPYPNGRHMLCFYRQVGDIHDASMDLSLWDSTAGQVLWTYRIPLTRNLTEWRWLDWSPGGTPVLAVAQDFAWVFDLMPGDTPLSAVELTVAQGAKRLFPLPDTPLPTREQNVARRLVW